MPPKGKKPAPKKAAAPPEPEPPKPSASKALVSVGKREVVVSGKNRSKRNEEGQKPTTVKALVLRNGKYGARGTGEMMVVTRLLGREKLDLLVEDMINQKAAGALMSPFNMDTALKIADSQCSSFLDDIAHLQDPVLFVPIIEAEWTSRVPSKDRNAQEPLKSATAVARTVANRIHNVYMLASAWKIVADALHDLEDLGLTDDVDVKVQLKNNSTLRSKYIAIFHFVTHTLLKFFQERFSVLATTTPHFAQYFKVKELTPDDAPEEQCVFDYAALKAAGKSFIDSIILEICFPGGHYPQMLLMQLLHEGVEEAPKDSKRFPQTLWDALGDLSDVVRLHGMLETPLLDPEFKEFLAAPAEKLPGYDAWYDAVMLSLKATEEVTAFKDIIFPLAKAKKKPVLESMWKAINQMYKASTKKDVDTLWRLHDALNRTPQWHSIYIPGLKNEKDGKPEKKKLLAITEAGEDSDDSMPELQSVSNSSDGEDTVSEDESEDEEDDGDETSSEYDEEHEDDIRDQIREAMDAAHEGDLFEHSKEDEEEAGKGNAFLKLLGSLRGRVFNSSTRLGGKKTPARGPKTGFFGTPKTGPPPKTSEQPKPKSKQAATVEEVDDEDDNKPTGPKKKKNKKKKKKKAGGGAAAGAAEADGDGDDDGEEAADEPAPATTTTTTIPPPSTPASPAKKTPVTKSAATGVAGITAQMSTTSLQSTETVAQSAHSYLKGVETKSKVKTHGAAAPEKEKKSGGFLGKFAKENKQEEEKSKKPKHSFFSRLSKKATSSMHQLLRTSEDETKGLSSMKWETFLKLMREMGFTYDPSTAGSSVRFDPPDPKDVSITFHRPHPDPTIQPIMLREFAKKLRKSYGWSEADFFGHAAMA
ncbi:hypothetical protein HMN09_00754400 [Mycena chlorophos]|uniref:Uncharacterized protein n=1 Tax=Mycena chlorophos TaxID=658473 RepID=A0A8H6W507_MYCCL|nr:hypothetical protein HMN09_00754400 [Mycena chlorophos]